MTGASSGIGRATALRLGRDGYSVCVNYYSDREAADADAVVRDIDPDGVRSYSARADVSSEHDVITMVSDLLERWRSLDLLVNNAGIERQRSLIHMDLETWNAILATNLTGTFLCMREAARIMIQQHHGVIVNISSVHEYIPWPGFAHYCASKAGVKLLMETASKELAPSGVRVLNIAPGAIATPINASVLEDEQARHAVVSEVPLGRFGTADEIAAAVAWAASDEASYLTGTTITIDGGMSTYPRFV